MSGFAVGQQILASWLGGPWQPATVLEVNSISGLLRVRFADGRETWLAGMKARLPVTGSGTSAGSPNASLATSDTRPAPPPLPAPSTDPVAFAPTQTMPVATPVEPAPIAPPGDFHPVAGTPIDDGGSSAGPGKPNA